MEFRIQRKKVESSGSARRVIRPSPANRMNESIRQTISLRLDKGGDPVPESYDEYYLQIVKTALRYACPIGAAVYIFFFVLDWMSTSSAVAIKTLTLRAAVSVVTLAFWYFAPLLRSVRAAMVCLASLYVFVLLDMIGLISVIPNSLILGQASLLLVTMCACGMFFLKPIPFAIAGSIGVMADIFACVSAGLTYKETVINACQLGSGILFGSIFLALLERELRKKHTLERSLQAEKEQSDILLREILPGYVIERIGTGVKYIADAVSEVDVIFIDIVGFSAMSTYLAPKHLLEIVGTIFRSFDENCERHGVTKIKTIGDSYMAATNLPESSELSGVRAIEFCQEALLSVENVANRHDVPISVRIGVATGGVIAGVLSLKRPAYDLWGETVNLASRMESTGEPGRIQIAEKTYWRIKNRFECEARGVVDVKGVGAVKTYFIK